MNSDSANFELTKIKNITNTGEKKGKSNSSGEIESLEYEAPVCKLSKVKNYGAV